MCGGVVRLAERHFFIHRQRKYCEFRFAGPNWAPRKFGVHTKKCPRENYLFGGLVVYFVLYLACSLATTAGVTPKGSHGTSERALAGEGEGVCSRSVILLLPKHASARKLEHLKASPGSVTAGRRTETITRRSEYKRAQVIEYAS